MARKREPWFEFSWLGHRPITIQGALLLFGGVGGQLGLVFTSVWLADNMPGSNLAVIPVVLLIPAFLTFFILVGQRTRTKGEQREDDANHEARRLFRAPRR